MIHRDDSCQRDWDNYEPDYEYLDWELENKRQFESLVSDWYHSERDIRASTKPNKLLREISKERESFRRSLLEEHQFDVDNDCFEFVDVEGDCIITVARDGRERTLSRTNKRRMRKDRRKRARQFSTNAGRNPAQASMVRKAGALVAAVAVM